MAKNGKNNSFLWFHDAARCAISDRMAPGKWWKFAGGAWDEPGLGGRASRVTMGAYGIYGRVIFSGFLKKYLRIGPHLGVVDTRFSNLGLTDASLCISTCDDLARQEWTPTAKLFDRPDNDKNGITMTDGDGIDPFVCGRRMRVYNYWLYLPSRALDVEFVPGAVADAGMPRYGSYACEPAPESGDPVMSRRTRIVGCDSADVTYDGDWCPRSDPRFFLSIVRESVTPWSSITFPFRGTDVYWRATAGPDCGKADVFIDGRREETVDCFCEQAIPCQFAFIRRGLDPRVPHEIRIVPRVDRNPRSTGAAIRHMAFEHSAESYRASAGFCAVMGKNRWRYQSGNRMEYRDMGFVGLREGNGKKELVDCWTDGECCRVGHDHQIADRSDAVRAWIAPHDGTVRVDGVVKSADDNDAQAEVAILANLAEVWPARAMEPGSAVSHDFTLPVKNGDAVRFMVRCGEGACVVRVAWDPGVTFKDG